MNESVKRYVVIGIAAVLVVLAVRAVWNTFGGPDSVALANTVTYICTETEQVFQIELEPGMTDPLENPRTGTRTLWPAEMCYWNECGPKGGTSVLMNSYRGEEEPTHCPACGHIVRFRNPKPPDYPPMPD